MVKVIGVSIGLCILSYSTGIAATWYVDGSVSWSGSGTTWEAAFKTIQEGVDAASQGDTVIVARGTYIENLVFSGENIVLRSKSPLDPSVVASTVIDGDQVAPVVIFSALEDETCVLAGFTIRNGYGHDGGKYGAGIYGGGTQATIRNNIITQNRAPST